MNQFLTLKNMVAPISIAFAFSFTPAAVATTKTANVPTANIATTDAGKAMQLKAYFSQCAEAKICNGAFLVAKDGEILFSQVYGHDGSDEQNNLNIDSQFDIGSVSKQFTAMAILRLAHNQQLNITDDVRRFLPSLPYKGITLQHLLTHTSGVPDMMQYYTQQYRKGEVNEPITNSGMLTVLSQNQLPNLEFIPGDKYSYSNTGYALLVNVIEAASNKPFEQFMQDEFFKPLNMKHTLVRTFENDDEIKNRVYGYSVNPDGSHSANDQIPMLYLTGMGAIYSTIDDMFRWDKALRNAQAVSPSHWQLATSPVMLNDGSQSPYGFGLSLKLSNLHQNMIAHGGHWRGFKSNWAQINNLTVIQLTNNSQDDSVDENLAAVESLMENIPYKLHKKTVVSGLYKKIRNGNFIEARHWLSNLSSEAYEIKQDDVTGLGYWLYRNDEHELAMSVFELAFEQYPMAIDAQKSLLDALIASNQFAYAKRLLTKIAIVNPEYPEIESKMKQVNLAIAQQS